ncbi:MAG: DUF5668 domain-containing protein [Ignavibacteriaceae bacterium]
MKTHHPIIIYLFTFLALSILLELLGIIDFKGTEILSYSFIFTGIALFYNSFGKNKKGFLFLSTSIFLIGIVLFLIANFEFRRNTDLIIPALFFILGISFLMLFFEDRLFKMNLIFSIILILAGVYFTFSFGEFNFNIFKSSIIKISIKYWPVVLIVSGIIFLLRRLEKK